MRKLSFIGVLVSFLILFAGTGCTDKKISSADSITTDSVSNDSIPTDTLETLLEEMPLPKAADELFDDFIFNFAANRKLQRERTDFPLNVDTYGKLSTIDRNHWAIERFFMKQGYYTLVVNSHRQLSLGKDTSLTHVLIEKIMYEKNQVKKWDFNRVNGLWRLQKMSYSSLASHKDSNFLRFYNMFASDSTFQSNALAEQVEISTPDPEDDFSRIEGSVMAEQWPAFAPWMPTDVIYNIHYGAADYKPSPERIFIIRGIANGLETELTFHRDGDSWKLVKMES